MDERYGPAGAALARLSRRLDAELRRGRISADAFRAGGDRWRDLAALAVDEARAVPTSEIEAEIAAVMPMVLAMPRPTPRALPPLPKTQIAVDEVVVLFRRLLTGEAEARMLAPPARWSDIWHAAGEIRIDGWTLRLATRNGGISYTAGATAPDGRSSDHEDFEAREGDPYALLADDEQERLDALFDRLEADPDETREVLRFGTAETPLERRHLLERISAWLALKGAPETDGSGRPTGPEERLAAVATGSRDRISAADEEYLWDLEDALRRMAPPPASEATG